MEAFSAFKNMQRTSPGKFTLSFGWPQWRRSTMSKRSRGGKTPLIALFLVSLAISATNLLSVIGLQPLRQKVCLGYSTSNCRAATRLRYIDGFTHPLGTRFDHAHGN